MACKTAMRIWEYDRFLLVTEEDEAKAEDEAQDRRMLEWSIAETPKRQNKTSEVCGFHFRTTPNPAHKNLRMQKSKRLEGREKKGGRIYNKRRIFMHEFLILDIHALYSVDDSPYCPMHRAIHTFPPVIPI